MQDLLRKVLQRYVVKYIICDSRKYNKYLKRILPISLGISNRVNQLLISFRDADFRQKNHFLQII